MRLDGVSGEALKWAVRAAGPDGEVRVPVEWLQAVFDDAPPLPPSGEGGRGPVADPWEIENDRLALVYRHWWVIVRLARPEASVNDVSRNAEHLAKFPASLFAQMMRRDAQEVAEGFEVVLCRGCGDRHRRNLHG